MSFTSRRDFLTNFVSRLDDGRWDALVGDGQHSVKHHQQASDFLRTGMYRNDSNLMTCASCHDPHGNSGLSHQIRMRLDSSDPAIGNGLCMSCHDATFPAGATLAARQQTHYASHGVRDTDMDVIS